MQDSSRDIVYGPSFMALWMSFSAIGPCPWPKEIVLVFSPPKPWASANLSSDAMGSAPGERTKISAAQQ